MTKTPKESIQTPTIPTSEVKMKAETDLRRKTPEGRIRLVMEARELLATEGLDALLNLIRKHD